MSFSKEHLTGLYNWAPEPETPLFTDSPTRRTFDRFNGHQVLFIINRVLEVSGTFTIEDGRKLEALIINKLPFDPCSELTVFNWLQKEMMVSA